MGKPIKIPKSPGWKSRRCYVYPKLVSFCKLYICCPLKSSNYYKPFAFKENFAWKSDQGQYIQLTETSLEKLSDIEAESLIKIALDKIRELNIGTNIGKQKIAAKSYYIIL